MSSIWGICLSFAFTLFVIVQSQSDDSNTLIGYVPGVSGMPKIDENNCVNDEIRNNPSLSNAVECARPCHSSDKPKTCYYSFVIERYPVNGQACSSCTPNVTNSICADCQCVPADGVERMALTVNRMIPGPTLDVCVGDYVVIDVQNSMKDEAVTIHWHGVFQQGSQYYDGVPFITQCPILTGNSFRYQFRVSNAGTHFWHAHTGLQKMNGVFGAFVVRLPLEEDPNKGTFDTDLSNHVVVINDWMHEDATERYPGRSHGITGQHPDTLLINGKGRYRFSDGSSTNTSLIVLTVEAKQRHRFRLINSFCTVCPGQLTIEGHNLTLIETDGRPIKPVNVNSIVSFPGERYDFVLDANQPPGTYWIQLRALDQCSPLRVQQVGLLRYVGGSSQPNTSEPTYDNGLPPGVVVNPLDDSCHSANPQTICINKLKDAMLEDESLVENKTDIQIYVAINFHAFGPAEAFEPNHYREFLIPVPGANVAATLNGMTFKFPSSPLASQLNDVDQSQICDMQNPLPNCNGNCTCTNTMKIPLHATVELILVDTSQAERLTHPFHMHGYAFRVMGMGQPLGPYSSSGNSTPITVEYVQNLDKSGQIKRHLVSPTGKDTLAVPNNGYTVIRFRADNPGYWFFHCHFAYHQIAGMESVIKVGEQSDLPPVPPQFPKCGNFKPEIVPTAVSSSKSKQGKHSKWHPLIIPWIPRHHKLWHL